MWAPAKPWESPSNNFRSVHVSSNPSPYRPSTGIRQVERKTMEENERTTPPTIPARPAARLQPSTVSNYGYGNYGTYGGYQGQYNYGGNQSGYGGYGGYGTYNNNYGGNRYGLGYNNNDNNNQPSSSFVEHAERNSRVAFDSIHSIVQAFGSIAMMFESTFFAVHSSFRAVLGVADHFSRLRHNLVQAVGSNFAIKWLRNIIRKLMVLIGLRNPTSVEEVWNEVKSATMGQSGERGERAWRSWPLLLFFGVVLGTPWLIWKFLSSLGEEVEQDQDWMTGDGDHVLGKALFDFVGENEDELSFSAGDSLRIAPKQQQPRIRGWLLATVDETAKGILPANYIKILGFKRGKKAKVGGIEATNVTSSVENEFNNDVETPTERTFDLEQAFVETMTDSNNPSTVTVTADVLSGGSAEEDKPNSSEGIEEIS